MKTISILKKLINIYFYLLVISFIALAIIPIIQYKKGKFGTFHIFSDNYDMSNLSFGKFIFVILIILVLLVIFIRAIYLLKNCLNDLHNGNYFSELVVNNFNKIGKLFLIYSVCSYVFAFIFRFFLLNSINFGIDHSLILSVIMGLFFLFLSEAFSKARNTEQENELTI